MHHVIVIIAVRPLFHGEPSRDWMRVKDPSQLPATRAPERSLFVWLQRGTINAIMLLVDVLFNHEAPIARNEEMEHSPVFSTEDAVNPVRVTLMSTLEDGEHRRVVLNGINGRRRLAKVTAGVAGN